MVKVQTNQMQYQRQVPDMKELYQHQVNMKVSHHAEYYVLVRRLSVLVSYVYQSLLN